jgi:hypothetical protein
MEDRSLYNQRRPKSFEEFLGQDTRSLQVLLRERRKRPFLITGPSGTGKTTLAGLIARSYLCDNPGEGGSLLCGHCPTCTEDWHELIERHPLINCHTVEDAERTREILGVWLERSQSQPIDPHTRTRKKHIFILDELQLLKSAPLALSQLLAPLEEESYRERCVWVLLSMDYTSLPEKPRVAISNRCHNVVLRSLQEEDIERALLSHPDVTPELARAVSLEAYSKGNLRQAWSVLERVLLTGEKSADAVHDLLGGGANPKNRWLFWTELSSFDESIQRGAIQRLKSWRVEEDTLVSLIEEDLLMLKGGPYLREFCQALGWWHTASPRPPLWTVFLAFRGCKVFDLEGIHEEVQPPPEERPREIPAVFFYRTIREFMS